MGCASRRSRPGIRSPHLEALVLHPELKLHEFDVQLLECAFEFLALELRKLFVRPFSGRTAALGKPCAFLHNLPVRVR